MQNVFIVGAKNLGNYGGYETFVDKLTEYHKENEKIKYHVAIKDKEYGEFEKNNARCFKIKVPNIGPAQAIYYDVKALSECCKYIKEHNIDNPIVYILACRIGPFAKHFRKKIHKLGGRLYINPDGHEWMRAKWSAPVRKYWKISEKMMVKQADLLICDSKNIEKYIKETYSQYNPETTFIAYGADIKKSILADDDKKVTDWFKEKEVKPKEYYLVVGRFVPENNYETMIREFMSSNTKKDLVIVTGYQESKLYPILNNKYHFENDSRIKFVGTIYDDALLKSVRKNAFAYLHGHEVGGTNPSLLEALGSTSLNLLLNVGFNQEVGLDSCIYWGKEKNNLKHLIEHVETFDQDYIDTLGKAAKERIKNDYSWAKIVSEYENLFLRKKDL